MQNLTYTLILLFAFTFVQAQNDIKARIEFEEAERAFEAEEYEKAIKHITETEKLIGQWTPVTAFLKIEALHAMTDMGNFSDPNMQPLYEEVSKYMAHMNSLSSSEVPLEKYKVVYEIERVLNVHRLQERQSPEFIKAWEQENHDIAIHLYMPLTQEGNSWAMRNIGWHFERKKDNSQALAWYKKAVENGNMQAVSDLASLDTAWGNDEGRKWHEQAYKMGHPHSMYAQGWYTEYKDENMQKAMGYYLQAAELGSVFGLNAVAEMYAEGKGVAKDFKKAEEYYLKAAKKNSGEAMSQIGILYHDGENGIVQNHQTAMQWYLKAAEKNIGAAMRNIGWIYENGHGDFTKDYAKAEKWYKMAIENGQIFANNYLGDLYSLSDYNQPQKALEAYEKAAAAGYIAGMLKSANLYFSGKGNITKDYTKAAHYYECYFNNENRDKKNDTYLDFLITIYNRGGHGIKKDKEKMKYWRNFKRQL